MEELAHNQDREFGQPQTGPDNIQGGERPHGHR